MWISFILGLCLPRCFGSCICIAHSIGPLRWTSRRIRKWINPLNRSKSHKLHKSLCFYHSNWNLLVQFLHNIEINHKFFTHQFTDKNANEFKEIVKKNVSIFIRNKNRNVPRRHYFNIRLKLFSCGNYGKSLFVCLWVRFHAMKLQLVDLHLAFNVIKQN